MLGVLLIFVDFSRCLIGKVYKYDLVPSSYRYINMLKVSLASFNKQITLKISQNTLKNH